MIADLDLLVSGFDHISPDYALTAARTKLLAKVDELIVDDGNGPTTGEAKDAYDSGELRGLWQCVRQRTEDFKTGMCTHEQLSHAVEAFYAWQRKSDRLTVLKSGADKQMLKLKHRLLEMLRAVDVYVLERGAIEEYYPQTIVRGDKTSRAQDFCTKVATRDAILGCCGEQTVEREGVQTSEKEFILIFKDIFQ